MTKQELDRLVRIDKRVREIAEEFGLLTTDILFEIVPPQRVLEGMSYMFPTNFSHWSFGRDYERNRTIYDYTGGGIPYEQVWNFEQPRAFLVETNPLALNAMILAHVYGHVDFFRGSRYLQHGLSFSDIAEEARNAAKRFTKYEERYGKEAVEKVIDSAMSIMWHQNPDPFFEEPDEEEARERLLEMARAKLERDMGTSSEFGKPLTAKEIALDEAFLSHIENLTPPEPCYDLLFYIKNHITGKSRDWVKDILSVVRNQARALAPNGRTKMLDEGWATYWHVQITRQLFEEGLLTPEEHGVFNHYHSGVLRKSKLGFNWYNTGLNFYKHVKECYDKGQFGREYEECEDPYKRSRYDTHAMKGTEKIFQIRSGYSDRMAVDSLFSDDFIREQELYVYAEKTNEKTGESITVVVEDNPAKIRELLKSLFTNYGTPLIRVEDGNYHNQGELYLRHQYSGFELDSAYRNATLEKIYHLWGRKVNIESIHEGAFKIFSYNGKEHKIRGLKQ
ncbi:MAG: SpoVR family protein [Candidatus Liptonbacteria bacterium]|nr:SpoVR family protein [Candidatus Liptonbacteria bacterium]